MRDVYSKQATEEKDERKSSFGIILTGKINNRCAILNSWKRVALSSCDLLVPAVVILAMSTTTEESVKDVSGPHLALVDGTQTG
jgi:hypothetical protein